jgi:hypothetical protein
MPRMNNKGPESKGSMTGRGLGSCQETSKDENIQKLGKGMGLRRKSGGGQGQGKRLKSNIK